MIPLDRLPRRCPICQNDTIIGHGCRLRQSHDERDVSIWARRGICRPCKKTFTILPDWLVPSAHYSLHCRQQVITILTEQQSTLALIKYIVIAFLFGYILYCFVCLIQHRLVHILFL